MILQAGASEAGLALAARTADVVFSVVQDLEESRAACARLAALVAAEGREAQSLKVLPGVMPIIGRTRQEAADLLGTLQSYVDDTNALAMLSTRLGTDMARFPLDGPVPDLPLPDTSHGFARTMLAKAKRDRMTLRQLYDLTAAARGHWVLCDTPEGIADTLQAWFEAGAADGFNILPPWFPGAFDDFVDLVVPVLQRRGLFRTAYAGRTLRDHLGLARPANRLFG